MRYSKRKIITASIISFLFVVLVVFLIVKGISDSKRLTDANLDSRLTASVSNKKEEDKKKESEDKTTKKETKESTTKKKKTEEVVVETKKSYDTSIYGKYTVKELKIGDKKYTTDEINKLKKEGYSMSLNIDKHGIATLAVMDINGVYEVTDTYFNNGIKKYEYAKNVGKIRIEIDDKLILFEKE